MDRAALINAEHGKQSYIKHEGRYRISLGYQSFHSIGAKGGTAFNITITKDVEAHALPCHNTVCKQLGMCCEPDHRTL